MSVELQISNLKNIPFMGSGKELVKKEITIGSKVIVKDISGGEYTVEILKNTLNDYVGITDLGVKMELSKQNVFLIL